MTTGYCRRCNNALQESVELNPTDKLLLIVGSYAVIGAVLLLGV